MSVLQSIFRVPSSRKTLLKARKRRLLLEKLESKKLLAVLTDSISPLPNSHDSARDASIVIDFDANIDGSTVDDSNLVFHGMQSGAFLQASGAVFGTNGDVVTLNPGSDFFPGELIQGTITNQILADGTSDPAQPQVIQFRAGTTGGGEFSNSGQMLTNSAGGISVSLGDVDGDSDLDAFVAIYGGNHQLWINMGGSFSNSGQTLNNSAGSTSVSLGDVDGDGDLDAFVANRYGDHQLWKNDSGSFTLSQTPSNLAPSRSVSLGDLDGDGDLDAFVANISSNHQLWINSGDGSFSDSGQTLANNASSTNVALGDVDGDGDLDVFVTNWQGNLQVWANDGGNFGIGQTLPNSARSRSVSLGDVDGDDDLDAFVANDRGDHRLWINEGGSFSQGQAISNSARSYSASLGDVDGDGDLDAFVATLRGDHQLWTNQAGSFSNSEQTLANLTDSRSVTLGDVDGDGDLDAFVATYRGDYHQLWINGPALPTVDLAVSADSGSETAQSELTITATISEAVEGDQTVDVDVSGMGISEGDYTLSSTSITIPEGQTIGTATFTIVDDAVVEGEETAQISLSNPSDGIALGSTTSQNVTISDNDEAGFQLIETGGSTIVSQGGTVDSFDVVLTAAPTSNVVFDLSHDNNFTIVNPTTLTFTPENWNVRQAVSVQGAANAGQSNIIVSVNDGASNDFFDNLADMQVSVDTLSIAEPRIYQAGKELVLLGTDSRDQIAVREMGGQIQAQVISYLPGGVTPEIRNVDLSSVERIAMSGFGGDDTITAIGLNVPIFFDGGEGNDQLTGGLADDILIGGPGDDRIIGNSGDDLAIGGLGLDLIFDGAGNDLLVSDATSHDTSRLALEAIHAEWTSGRDYADRVANIRGVGSGERANGSTFLRENIEAQTDAAQDRVFGDATGQDLFFAELGDILVGKRSDEDRFEIPTY